MDRLFVRVGYGIGPALLDAVGIASRLLRVQLISRQSNRIANLIGSRVCQNNRAEACTFRAVLIIVHRDFRRHFQRTGLPLDTLKGAGGIFGILDGAADCIV